MKIAFFEATAWEKERLKEIRFKKAEKVEFFAEELTPANAKKAAPFDVVSVFIYSHLNRELLKKLPRLKMIATRSTGFDHIDLKEANKKKIVVSNVPFYGENTVAEHTFALILALSRNIYKAHVRTERGNYQMEGLRGFDLQGRTIGIVGGGRIGLHVARMAKGFSMNVLVYDPIQNAFMADVLGFHYASLDELLGQSDIISLHAPYNKKTHHLINESNIEKIKRGAILINTSRGGLIDTSALLKALDRGILSGAGLDVLEGEELIKEERQLLSHRFSPQTMELVLKNKIILHREDVVYTPHIAFYSTEALQRIIDTSVTNIQRFLEGKPINRLE